VFELTVDEREAVHVQLLTMNDLHGKIDQTYQEDINHDGVKENLGRMDYMEAYFKQYEAMNPNTLVVHSGDATGGSAPVSALFNDEPTVNVMNAMGMSVGTVGNHEFDRGTQELLRLINGGDSPKGFAGYQGMNYPLLAANVVYKDSGKLVLPAYQIQEVGGVKVGFIGVVTQSAAGMVMPSGIQDIQVTDETKAVNDAAAELKAQGVHAIVVLAHMDATQSGSTITGQAADLAINGDPDIDVILAAHNHLIVNGTVNGKLITQAYEYGKAFGDVNLDIDPGTDDIVHKTAQIVYNDQSKVQPDADVSALIQKYEDLVAPKLNEVEGEAAIPMVGGYTNTGDNALGNLIADSMKAAMHSDFAMVNGGGIRDNLNAGPITWNELFNILPFNNILESVQVKGSDMVTIINNQLSKNYGPDFSVAGLKYTYNLSSAKVENVYLPDGSKIDPNKTYTLTVNNFMGTATAFKYASIGKLGQNPVTGPEDLPALVDYVKNYQGELAYQSEGRITPANTLEVTNKPGATDTVYVNKLYPGDKVRVYASATATATTPLAETTVASGQYYALITGLDLGANAGTAYVAVVSGGKTEGPKMPVNFSAE
jgi:2',3'-cyclic-nucleotide 2'-phosphodiesterase (5'-nucleotidase family)